ncbi:MAG: hypothetical protein E8D40_17510 [Nitrospira sp.]|nr:MAG: hypothetical protein E8D40_17510 [Nitrospira sp.]
MIDGTFRANPSYELVLGENLSSTERELVGDAQSDNSLYGYLRPHKDSGLQWRTVSTDTALLLLTLAKPGPVPAYIRTHLDGKTATIVTRLVLDGVLEIEHSGAFHSGPEAIERLLELTDHDLGTIGRLSVAALQYAQTLEGLSQGELAMRLYCYGRKPLSPSWQNRLPSEEAIGEFLGLGGDKPVQKALDEGWIEDRLRDQRFWRMWSPRGNRIESNAMGYKLYISPTCNALPDALLATATTLARVPGVLGFKVGRHLHGLCRPDKLVAYFSRLESLHVAAAQLKNRLRGMPPHGVPFTAEITRDGLLSWGIDPPARQRLVDGPVHGSWRIWIANRLAEYMLAAKGRSDSGCWQFALDRLRLDGIDTETWVPTSGLWCEQETVD